MSGNGFGFPSGFANSTTLVKQQYGAPSSIQHLRMSEGFKSLNTPLSPERAVKLTIYKPHRTEAGPVKFY